MTWFIIDSNGFRYPVGASGLSLGRAGDNDVVLDDDEASRYHAFVQTQGEQAWLYDRGSANGVFVGDVRIMRPYQLQSGDVIRLGQTSMTAEYVVPPAPPRTTAATPARPASPWGKIIPAVLVGAAIGLGALALVVVFFVRPLLGAVESPPDAGAGIYDSALDATVFLATPAESADTTYVGTGAVLSETGRLLTAYPVVYDPRTKQPYNRKRQVLVGLSSVGGGQPPDRWYLAHVVRADPGREFAVLQIFARQDGSPLPNSFSIRPIPFGDTRALRENEPVAVISYVGGAMREDQIPQAQTLVIGEGQIIGFLPDAALNVERGWIHSDIGLDVRNVGGLGLDRQGRLVGLYTGSSGTGAAGSGSLLRPIDLARPLIVGAQ